MGLDPFTLMAGATLVGGLVGSSASKKAANTQADAANRATDAQTGMFDKTVSLEAPFRQSGLDAQTKLNTLLGVGPSGPTPSFGGLPATAGAESADAIRARLMPQFNISGVGTHKETFSIPGDNGPTSDIRDVPNGPTVNQAGLDAAVQSEMSRQQSPAGAPNSDPSYGSLLKPFGMSDFQLDPGIQFQTQQGNLALQNSQAAKDGVMSGAALKDLIGYNQGMAGTGFQSAFDRYMAGKSFTLGSLSDTAGRGQAAAGNTVNAAPNFSSGIAGTIQGAGNAQAAGTVGSANALSGSLTGASNAFFLRNLLSKNNPLSGGAGTNMSIEPAAIQPEFA